MQKDQPNHQYNKLSTFYLNSGKSIPIIGYGTYQLKGEDCLTGLQYALKIGYRHIDTASIYRNQVDIAKVLKKCGIQRKQLYITSKIAPTQHGYKEAKQACETIIKKLQCDYLDLLLIHWPGVSKIKVHDPKNAEIRDQTWKALIQLKTQGKVKDIGVSNYLKHHLQDLKANNKILPAVNQIQVHPLLWQKQSIDFCRQNNIIVEAYSPLARGASQLMKSQIMLELSKKYNKTVAQVSLRYLIQEKMVVLPKSKTESRIKENFELFDFSIQQEDMKKISNLHQINLRTCWNPQQVKY